MTVLRLAFVLVCVMCAWACRAPTEIELTLRTELPCTEPAAWKGVAVYVGKPGAELETREPTLVETRCEKSGRIGSLVIVPSGDDDALVGVRVVAGTQVDPESCREANYQGCIVARRRLRFRPHQTLPLDIDLTRQCVTVPCQTDSTCVAGTCVGVSQVPATDEGDSDSELDSVPKDKRVRCGDDGLFCATEGDVCCLTVDVAAKTTHGACMPSADCAASSIVLHCDDSADCAPRTDRDGSPALCMLSYVANQGDWVRPTHITSSSCLTVSEYIATEHTGLALCQDEQPCLRENGRRISCQPSPEEPEPSQLPGYSWCKYDPSDDAAAAAAAAAADAGS